MRELKFRQALMSFGKFCGWHYWGFINGKFVSPAESSECSVANAEKYSHQYINHNDVDGKEIYTGSILQYDDMIGKVVFANDAFQFAVIKSLGVLHDAATLYPIWRGVKIIGNTTENPELLR